VSVGAQIGVITDEMITPRLAADMHLWGYDVISVQSTGRANKGISDEDQLAFATAHGRAIYTFNAVDYARLHREWHASGRSHAGIIVSVDLNARLGEMVLRLRRHLDTVVPSLQRDSLMILWP
jgi:hypothetical protein